jgi:hypothetical protein
VHDGSSDRIVWKVHREDCSVGATAQGRALRTAASIGMSPVAVTSVHVTVYKFLALANFRVGTGCLDVCLIELAGGK